LGGVTKVCRHPGTYSGTVAGSLLSQNFNPVAFYRNLHLSNGKLIFYLKGVAYEEKNKGSQYKSLLLLFF
jgi:hypothetical protein